MDPIKHFESLWEEAEALTEQDPATLYMTLDELVLKLESLKNKPNDVIIDSFGDVLFLICKISKRLNINAYVALHDAIDAAKEDLLDP